jgi:uncharacterized protein (DUF924 family)
MMQMQSAILIKQSPIFGGLVMSPALHVMPVAPGAAPAEALAIIDFWREAGPTLWFAKNEAFDRRFRNRFLTAHEAAGRGELTHWEETPEGALALVLLLDQFPRNAFRGTQRMYASDALARKIAESAIEQGYDRAIEAELQLFFYLPYGHSERLADQDRGVALCRRLPPPSPKNSERHRDIIRRFGRFPHRNPVLGREMTREEQEYLDGGGYRG